MSATQAAQSSATTKPGALAGTKVLDLTTVLMGPYATQILGDHGADIIKIEAPGGDTFRYPGASRHRGMGPMFMNTNRNKRSLVMDLKNPEARNALLEMAKSTDVVVYNVRPAAMTRLKLTYEDFRAANPSIIYVGAFGFGQDGPYAARPAFDDVIQAASGIADLASRAYGNGKPSYSPVNLCDRVVGLHLVSSILAAIVAKERTGKGQEVQVPMFETMATFVLGDHLGWRTYDIEQGEMCYARIMTQFRRPFATKDGYMCIIPYVDQHWVNLLTRLDRRDLLADPRFKSQTSRSENITAVYGFVDQAAAMFTTAEWLVILDELDIPHMPVKSVEDLLTDPHLEQVGLFERVEHPTEGEITQMRPTAIFSETPQSIRRHAPNIGEHSQQILREAGFTDDYIEELLACGAVK